MAAVAALVGEDELAVNGDGKGEKGWRVCARSSTLAVAGGEGLARALQVNFAGMYSSEKVTASVRREWRKVDSSGCSSSVVVAGEEGGGGEGLRDG